jgi:hypothetical protein
MKNANVTTKRTATKTGNAKKSNEVKATNAPKKVTEYGKNVLTVNAKLKEQTKSVGGAIRLLISFRSEIGLPTETVNFLKETQKDGAKYTEFSALVRRSKKGNTCPFFVLQAAHKALKKA